MADFNEAIVKTLVNEGGAKFTNNPDDKGGPTKFGICQASHPNVDIANLTEQQARDIYKRDYWDAVSGDRIANQLIAESIYDFAVNAGVKTSSKLAQTAIGLLREADGIIGVRTLAVLNGFDADVFLARFALAKISFYANIANKQPSQRKFFLGWVNRSLGGAL